MAQLICFQRPEQERPTLARLSRELAEVRECQEALKDLERRLVAQIARQRASGLRLAQPVVLLGDGGGVK